MTEAATIKYMGQPLRRREDFKFITGKGHYTDDMKSPGMLHMAVLRSPHAHAIIKHVDLSAAQSAPGVHLALSGADFVGKIGSIEPNWVIPGTKVPDRPVVAVNPWSASLANALRSSSPRRRLWLTMPSD